jgi:hypothetical protein
MSCGNPCLSCMDALSGARPKRFMFGIYSEDVTQDYPGDGICVNIGKKILLGSSGLSSSSVSLHPGASPSHVDSIDVFDLRGDQTCCGERSEELENKDCVTTP